MFYLAVHPEVHMKTRWLSGGQVAVVVAVITGTTLAAGCGSSNTDASVDDGYVHYDVAPITVGPGQSGMWIQWIASPFDHDQNIIDVIAAQQQAGHHAVLYSTSNVQPVGTTREMLNSDQYDIQFLGGVGGEGGRPIRLPPDVFFRLPAGRALVAQTHYMNTTSATVEGRTTVAVKFGQPSPNDKLASFFVSTSANVKVAPLVDSQQDVSCTLPKDLQFLMLANHMHAMGTTIQTTVSQAGAAATMLKDNPRWDPELTYNPDYTFATVQNPVTLGAGSTLATHCAWHNTSDKMLELPDEMCLFLGFFLGEKDVKCIDGSWLE